MTYGYQEEMKQGIYSINPAGTWTLDTNPILSVCIRKKSNKKTEL